MKIGPPSYDSWVINESDWVHEISRLWCADKLPLQIKKICSSLWMIKSTLRALTHVKRGVVSLFIPNFKGQESGLPTTTTDEIGLTALDYREWPRLEKEMVAFIVIIDGLICLTRRTNSWPRFSNNLCRSTNSLQSNFVGCFLSHSKENVGWSLHGHLSWFESFMIFQCIVPICVRPIVNRLLRSNSWGHVHAWQITTLRSIQTWNWRSPWCLCCTSCTHVSYEFANACVVVCVASLELGFPVPKG